MNEARFEASPRSTTPFAKRPGRWAVQRAIGPTIGLCTDPPLYHRPNDLASFDHRRQVWRLPRHGRVAFDTYFNGFSVRRWKETSPLDDVEVEVAFRGKLTLRLHWMNVGAIATVIDEVDFASPLPTVQRWPVRDWATLDDGILFLSVQARDDAVLNGFSFTTSTRLQRPVRLGVCITHFDRKPQIVPAVARLRRQLLDDPAFADKVGLVVVDNSRNLARDDVDGAVLLPNRNLGGSGGFARGMMYLRDAGDFTHVLFMDDDASCEVESIRRTWSLLAYARDPRIAVSGAMLRQAEPYRQFERGARFDGLCRPQRHGVDLRDPAVLASNEREFASDYGGWWFFACPLDPAAGYPYPYFVRGDDVDFALRNDFPIVHANGIASWQEDFALKHGPQTSYLDTRSHLMHMLHGFRGGRRSALLVSLRMFLLPNLTGQYEAAAAATMALEDVRQGPEFFREHADLAAPRRRIQALTVAERMRPIDAATMCDGEWTPTPERRLRTVLRWVTANGHLVPRVFFHRRPARFEKGFVLPLRGTFCRERVLVHHEFSGTGMTLHHSKRRFFANCWRFACAAAGLMREFPRLAERYRAAYPDLTGDRFWRTQFGLDPAIVPVTAPPVVADPAAEPTAVAPLARAA